MHGAVVVKFSVIQRWPADWQRDGWYVFQENYRALTEKEVLHLCSHLSLDDPEQDDSHLNVIVPFESSRLKWEVTFCLLPRTIQRVSFIGYFVDIGDLVARRVSSERNWRFGRWNAKERQAYDHSAMGR